MKHRHNKKRNTALIYEVLIKELTKSIVSEDLDRKKVVMSILKQNYNKNTSLYKELEIYKSLNKGGEINRDIAEKILKEAKSQYNDLDHEQVFKEQTKVVNMMNKFLGKDIFNNFIPSYRGLATIYQIFNSSMSPKKRVIFEQKIIDHISGVEEAAIKEIKAIDKLTFNTFLSSFNSSYGETLLSEQKKLLNTYITSFADNGLEMKIYLNEELGRLKEEVSNYLKESTGAGKTKIEQVLGLLDSFSQKPMDSSIIQNVLKVQQLVHEIKN
jgi:hypothetical protein